MSVSWTTQAQLQNTAFLPLSATDHIWLNGNTFGSNINVGSYQDSTHISDASDVQRDTTAAVNNTKYLSASQASVNSGAAQNMSTLTSGNIPFVYQFSSTASVSTTGATLYAYDGITDATPYAGINFYAAELGNSSWTAANGNGSALTLQNQSAGTTHSFYVAISASPSSTGAKTGSIKLTLSYS